MIGEIFVKKIDEFEIVAKEEKGIGKINIFVDKKLVDSKFIDCERIVYIDYSIKNNLIIGSGYEWGEVFSIPIKNNRFAQDISIIKESDASGKKSRSHSIVFDRNEKYAYSANIGLDTIYIYEVCDDELNAIGCYKLPDESGPRHIAFNKQLDIMYVISENSNEMFVFNQDISTGNLTLIEKQSVLPDNFSEVSYAQTLIVQEDNKCLLANNRGANTVAVFEILSDGRINKVADLDCKLFDFYKAEENVYGL